MTRLLLALFVATLACAQTSYDTILTGGRIVDGTGNPWFYGDLAIHGGRIARIAPPGVLRNAPAKERIDVTGLVVAPGFIDIQSQSKVALLTQDGRVIGKVTQGVTTEILGEGATNAPANDKTFAAQGDQGFSGPHGFDAWLRAMKQHGTSVNFGSFVGAATIRAYVKGMAQGAPAAAEVEAMQTLVRQTMEDGSFGIASALIYPPGNYATTAELGAMAKAMAPYGGLYITHMRSEGDQFLEAIDEALEIGRIGGVPVEIYHLKAGGQRNWAKVPQAIAKINAARAAGVDVSADMYPYIAGSTGLTAVLPPWTAADGKLFDNLANPAVRAKIRAEIQSEKTDWENMGQLAGPDGILIVGIVQPENKKYVGKRLSEIAAMQHKDWMDAAMDLILSEHRRVETVYFMMSEDNVKLQLQQPWIKIGTDSPGLDPAHATGLIHPRAYGTYARILGKYVRDEHVLTLEDAVRKMTSAVARRLSIQDRGLLQESLYADIAVFDPAAVIDHATYEQPHQLSTGVRYVFVNGVAVVREGKHTGALPGQIVRGPGYVAAH
jgi:dihydroorotase/N-acyl-D-amino-acid deacylase